MKGLLMVMVTFMLVFILSCGNDLHQVDTGDTANTGDTADTGNTADSADSADTGSGDECNQATDANFCTGVVLTYCDGSSNTWSTVTCPETCGLKDGFYQCVSGSGDTGDSADTGNTGNTGNTGDTGNSGNTVDTGDTGNTGDTSDTGDTSNPYALPYGSVTFNGNSQYVITDETTLDSTMIVMSAFATGTMNSHNIVPVSQGVYTILQYSETNLDYTVQQIPYNDDGSTMVNPMAIMTVNEDNFAVGTNIPVGFGSEDKAAFYLIDVVDGSLACMHAIAIGTMNVTDANGAAGAAGSFVFNGTLNLYSPKRTPYEGEDIIDGDITALLDVTACAPY